MPNVCIEYVVIEHVYTYNEECRSTRLSKATKEDVKREGVRVIRYGHGRENGKLGRYPHDPDTERCDNLYAEVLRARAMLRDKREADEAAEAEQPPNVVLRAVAAKNLDGTPRDDPGEGDSEREGKDVHS